MKKRALSLALALMMCLALLPVTAFAAEEGESTYAYSVNGGLDLTAAGTPSNGDGYTWTGDETNGYQLTLSGIKIDGDLTLPAKEDNCKITVVTEQDTYILGNIKLKGSWDSPTYPFALIFEGKSPLTIGGDIQGAGPDYSKVTVQKSANITVNGRIDIGSSGGANGTIIVTGQESRLTVEDKNSSSMLIENLQVTNGGTMHFKCPVYTSSVTMDKDSSIDINATSGPAIALMNYDSLNTTDDVKADFADALKPLLPSGCHVGESRDGGYTILDSNNNVVTSLMLHLKALLPENTVVKTLDFTNVGTEEGQTPATGPGYVWTDKGDDGYQLEFTNFQMDLSATSTNAPAIKIPNDKKVLIQITGENSIFAPGANQSAIMSADYTIASPVVIQGNGKLTTTSASGPFMVGGDLLIKNVTINATTTQSGIRSNKGDITLESAHFTMESDGVSAPCIWTSHGSMTLKNSTLNLTSKGDRGIFVRDGDLIVDNSTVEISAGYDSGISVGVSKETTGGSGYQPGVTPGRKILLSGKSILTSTCTSSYGIYLQGTLTVSAPAQLKAQGSSAAIAVFDRVVLDSTAVIEPAGGVVSPPEGSSKIFTVQENGNTQKSVEFKPAELTVSTIPSITYGATVQTTVTENPDLTAQVAIYNGEEKLGEGNLGEEITLNTSGLDAGTHTLTAKLQENKGSVSKDFTLTVGKVTPTVSNPVATDIQYGQKLSASMLSGEIKNPNNNNVTVEGGWSWITPDNQPTQTGSFEAQFTPTDTKNYNLPNKVQAAVTLNPATPTIEINVTGNLCAGQLVSVAAKVTNPHDESFVDGLPSSKLTYTIDGVTKEITDGKFTIPSGTAVGTGITITADTLAVDGKYTAAQGTKEITVMEPISVTDVTLEKPSLSLREGETITLTATVKPDNATNKTVTWSSNDETIATVDASGVVTALKAGIATITATADGETATCTVTVTKPTSGGGSSSGGATTYPLTTDDPPHGTVKADPLRAKEGTTVTLTVTPEEGYTIDDVTVTDQDGKEIPVTDQGDGKYTFPMPAGKVTVSASFTKGDTGYAHCPKDETCPIWPFTDASPTAWYHDGVHYCLDHGLMGGYPGSLFGPDDATTRGMIVTILYRLEGEPAAGSSDFTDVPAGQYYTDAVAWAAANGIVNGYGDGAFSPEDPIAREQMAAILYRYAAYKEYDVTARGDLSGYTDADQISTYAMDAMAWVNGEGVLAGTSATTLDPAGATTRAQAATILMRCCVNVTK